MSRKRIGIGPTIEPFVVHDRIGFRVTPCAPGRQHDLRMWRQKSSSCKGSAGRSNCPNGRFLLVSPCPTLYSLIYVDSYEKVRNLPGKSSHLSPSVNHIVAARNVSGSRPSLFGSLESVFIHFEEAPCRLSHFSALGVAALFAEPRQQRDRCLASRRWKIDACRMRKVSSTHCMSTC